MIYDVIVDVRSLVKMEAETEEEAIQKVSEQLAQQYPRELISLTIAQNIEVDKNF